MKRKNQKLKKKKQSQTKPKTSKFKKTKNKIKTKQQNLWIKKNLNYLKNLIQHALQAPNPTHGKKGKNITSTSKQQQHKVKSE